MISIIHWIFCMCKLSKQLKQIIKIGNRTRYSFLSMAIAFRPIIRAVMAPAPVLQPKSPQMSPLVVNEPQSRAYIDMLDGKQSMLPP